MEKGTKYKTVKVAAIIIAAFIGLVFISSVIGYAIKFWPNNQTPDELEYRTDLKPLADRFPFLADSEACYWKTSTINASLFPGPTDGYIIGFAVLSKDTFEKLKEEYVWVEDEEYTGYTLYYSQTAEFPEGIDPEVTGYTNFDWYRSGEFSKEQLTGRFGGELYLDMNNGVLYIDIVL